MSIVGINAYMMLSVKSRIVTSREASSLNADCILILGAGIRGDSPSLMLADRLDYGIELYELGASEKLLMSGDHQHSNHDEVNVMKKYAVSLGVPSEDVFMDHAGLSTYESMYRARDIFGVDRVIIVTQGYHLYRALYIAEQLGLDAYGVPSDPTVYAGQLYRDIREVAARVKDFGMCILKPEPTYLGEAISITGSGDVTND